MSRMRGLTFSLDDIVSQAAKTAASLSVIRGGIVDEGQLVQLCVGGLEGLDYATFVRQVKSGDRSLLFSEMQGLCAMLDFALGAKSGSVLANDSSVQFATFLVADLVSSGTDLVGPNSETEFPAFVNKLVKKLLLVAVKSNEAREKIVGVVGNSVVEFVELVGAFGCDKKTISIAHAVFGAVTDSPAQLHRQLTARLLPAASSTIAKLVSVESSPTLTSTPSLQETSARISELTALVFHNISSFFLKDSDLVRLKSQAAWDSILDTTVSVSSGIPQAQLEAYLKASLESFAHLSSFFTSDYDVVAPILPSFLKSVALGSILAGNSRLVFSKVKEFLDVVAAEHLEYDAPRTEISVVALEALSLLAFNVSELAGEAIEFLTKFILSPKLCVGNSHVHITVVRNCAIAMLKKSLVLLDDAAVTKSTLYIFVNTLQSSSVQGGAFVHEACVSAIAGLIPAISTRQTVEVAVPAIVRKIEASNTDDAQTRAMWESLEIATLTGSIDVLEEAYPVLSSSIVKGDRLKFECSLATKVSLPLVLLQKLFETFVERVSVLVGTADVGNDKGLFNLSTVIKALCDIPGFHPEVHASEELILSFRNYWLVVTAFVFAPRATWPKEWIPIVTSITSKTPTLALGAKHRSLEIDLVANSVLRLKVPDQVYHKVKSCLVGSLYSRASETKSVSNAIATFLLSVFQIELFRVGKGSFSFFLDYIKDERYYETDVFPLLQSIGEEVLFAYTKGKSIGKSSIQSSFKALLRCGSHRLVKVKHFASTCSVRLLNAVPALLWDKTLVCYMLDVVLYLDSKRLVLDDRLAVLKGKLGFELHFVDEIEQAQAAKEYRALCANLLNLALGYSLSETTLTMQGYLLDLQINYPDLLGERSDVIALLSQFCSREEVANDVIKSLNARAKYIGEVRGVSKVLSQLKSSQTPADIFKEEIKSVPTNKGVATFIKELNPVLQRCAAYIVSEAKVDEELLRLVCWTPITVFNLSSIETALPVWNYIMSARPDLNSRILYELVSVWESTIYQKKGLYEVDYSSADPFMNKMTYTPSKKPEASHESLLVHCRWIQFLTSRFKSTLWYKKEHVKIFAKFIQIAVGNLNLVKLTPALRKTVFCFLELAILVANELDSQSDSLWLFSLESLFKLAFKWYSLTPMWSNYQDGEYKTMVAVRAAFQAINVEKANTLFSTLPDRVFSHFKPMKRDLSDVKSLVLLLLDNELARFALWGVGGEKNAEAHSTWKDVKWAQIVRVAWFVHPMVALNLPRRFMGCTDTIEAELAPLILQHALVSVNSAASIGPLLKTNLDRYANEQRFLLYWSEVSPISAISYLSPEYNHPWILQYAFRVLEYHPVEKVFFYIPQMVQALRHDLNGYVEHFILKTAKTSQLFAHQIIWNMNANMFIVVKVKKHEERLDPDPLKPTLDKIIKKITTSLSGEDREFYEREFKFFAEVTGISGKLKPYIKKSKAEKKKKIDEEMRDIKVEVGVYLPSNPESTVVDIDRDSGRPLQSHAKAPFMATFEVKKDESEGSDVVRQSAIFKVGDDCRQDVLALQLISIFKNIVERAGLDVYLYPYRVVATDCGCGVIEVIPRSISRDMMGREKVNSLPNYFAEKYGSKDSFEFKKAQEAFVRSLAAYSVVLYLVSIKDRHNGNIMFDDDGHTVHIDFGFILDIAPGGIEFEASPFKLTTEFIELMGGDASASYKLFSELVVKTFLALRPFADEIVQMVALMLESGLPCFKGEGTIKKLRGKFMLELDDKKAAEFMLQQIQKSHENKFSRLYDRFQNIQNGIPF